MIVIYTSPGCASCRKAKAWLKEHDKVYQEKNIFSTILNEKELRFLLTRSENGTDDLISRRSKVIKNSDVDIDGMNLNELIRFVQCNPSVLKRPIILDEDRMLVGYDDEEIEVFDSDDLRNVERIMRSNCNPKCPNYQLCGSLRKDA